MLGYSYTHTPPYSLSASGAGFVNTTSLLLDGVDEYVDIDETLLDLAGTSQGTWSAWVKPADITPSRPEVFVSVSEQDLFGVDYIKMQITSAGKLSVTCFKQGTAQWTVETDNVAFQQDTWTHVAIVHNSVEPIIYVDGQAVNQSYIHQADLSVWIADLQLDHGSIGAMVTTSVVDQYEGRIDEVHLWSTGLLPAEITAIYNSGSPSDLTTDFGDYASSGSLVDGYRMGDVAGDNYNVDNPGEWTFKSVTGSGNDAVTVNCEESDVLEDAP